MMNKMLLVAAAVFLAGVVVGRGYLGGGPDPFAGINRNAADWVSISPSYQGQIAPWEGPASAWKRVVDDDTYRNCWRTEQTGVSTGATFCEAANRQPTLEERDKQLLAADHADEKAKCGSGDPTEGHHGNMKDVLEAVAKERGQPCADAYWKGFRDSLEHSAPSAKTEVTEPPFPLDKLELTNVEFVGGGEGGSRIVATITNHHPTRDITNVSWEVTARDCNSNGCVVVGHSYDNDEYLWVPRGERRGYESSGFGGGNNLYMPDLPPIQEGYTRSFDVRLVDAYQYCLGCVNDGKIPRSDAVR